MIYYNFGLLEATHRIHCANNTIKADQLDQFTSTVLAVQVLCKVDGAHGRPHKIS